MQFFGSFTSLVRLFRVIAALLLVSHFATSITAVAELAIPFEHDKELCAAVFSGEDITVIFTADPGINYNGQGENYYMLQALQDRQDIDIPVCYNTSLGFLADTRVALITTGEGPSTAQLCVAEVLRCTAIIKEMIYFGTAGFSPRKGGILNPPTSCELPTQNGTLIRPGDVCVSKHAVNWDCQGSSWSDTSAGYPNVCTLPAPADEPFLDIYNSQTSAEYRGWDCAVSLEAIDPLTNDLSDELMAASGATSKVAKQAAVQEYIQDYWGNMTVSTGVTWTPDLDAQPLVVGPKECAEIDTVYWWTGVPWDTQARGMVGYITSNDSSAPTVAVSAMEGIGFLAAAKLAALETGRAVPYSIIRAASDYTFEPITQAANGTWLPGPSVSTPSGLATGSRAPATMYAIETGSSVILGMLENRCLDSGKTASECDVTAAAGSNAPASAAAGPGEAPATPSSTEATSSGFKSGAALAVIMSVANLLY